MNNDKKINITLVISVIVGIALGALIAWMLPDIPEPSEPEQIRCYDRVYGFVYGCEVREDGDIEIIINEDGNRVIVGLCEKDPRYK